MFERELKNKSSPGVQDISALIKALEDKYAIESWNTRNIFNQTPKSSPTRAAISDYKQAPSPLSNEVQPEDIVEVERTKKWAEMDEDDYDGNYIASTDPLHPVNTDYAHPMEDDDGSWTFDHLPSSELESPSEDCAIDFYDTCWKWEDEGKGHTSVTPASTCNDDREDIITGSLKNATDGSTAQEPTARRPNTETLSFPTSHSMTGSGEDETHRERIEQVIKAFWDFVGGNTTEQQSKHLPSPDKEAINNLFDALGRLDIPSPPGSNSSQH